VVAQKTKNKKIKMQSGTRGGATAPLAEARGRADRLKKLIKTHKRELRDVRREIKAAKKAAKRRLKAARAEAKKRLARLAAAARRKRADLAKAIAPKPVAKRLLMPTPEPVVAKTTAKKRIVKKTAAPAQKPGTPIPVPTSVEQLVVVRSGRVSIDRKSGGAKQPEPTRTQPPTTMAVAPTPGATIRPS
jgi:hypothetical protein